MKIKNIKLQIGDLIIVVCIIALSLGIFLCMIPNNTENKNLEIYLDSQLYKKVELNYGTDMEIEIDENFHNTIEIKNGKVRVINSNCPDEFCENTGFIEKTGDVIVCIPNKLLIKIVGVKNENEFDAVVG